jgi:hypothetical protein
MGYIKGRGKTGGGGGGSPFYQTKYESVIGLLRYVHPAEILAAEHFRPEKMYPSETYLANFCLLFPSNAMADAGKNESTASTF